MVCPISLSISSSLFASRLKGFPFIGLGVIEKGFKAR
jgi:hypothetical protein